MKSGEKMNEIDVKKMIALEQELYDLKRENGIEPREGRISEAISRFFERRDAKGELSLNKKKYILFAVFTGWFGGHRFYARQYPVAVLYLLLFWTGFGFAMTLIDLLIAIPKPVDENGLIHI